MLSSLKEIRDFVNDQSRSDTKILVWYPNFSDTDLNNQVIDFSLMNNKDTDVKLKKGIKKRISKYFKILFNFFCPAFKS